MFSQLRSMKWLAMLGMMVLAFETLPDLARADQPAAPTVIISGSVIDQHNSLPVAGVALDLLRDMTVVAKTTTDRDGKFAFAAQPQGVYAIVLRAVGYASERSDDIVAYGNAANVTLTLRRTETTSDARVLGHVVANGRAATLQTTTTIQQQVDPQVMLRTNQIRVAEVLAKLPGVNFTGQDSAVGDDIAIDIRGLKPSETQVLLDGHPIGPFGVYPGTIGGGSGAYDFQDSPLFALQNTVVTYGSGATGLYGVDAVGGAVDLQTLNPSVAPQTIMKYGLGGQGKQLFAVQMTGTENKFGYVFLHGVDGTYGDFSPQFVAQTGSRGNDFTSATLAKDTYLVTGNYLLRNDLVKLRYSFTPKSSLTLTGYSATSWDDKSGNGDNDYVTYPYALHQALNNPNCSTPTVPSGITVTLNSGSTCVTPQQYAAGASGPAGGGQNPFQALRSQDYHARYVTSVGHNEFVLDSFIDNYGQVRQRPPSNINGPSVNALNNIYRAFGTLISDDIALGNNDFGLGLYSQRQYFTGNTLTGAGNVPNAALFSKLDSFFVRDAYAPTDKLSYFLNLWLKHSLLGGNSFDPRLSVVYQPTPQNVFRLTGGGSSADPAPIAVTLTGTGGINPGNCKTFGIGTVPSSGEQPERAHDLEASFAHSFFGDTTSQLTLYDTNEINTIFEGSAPAANYLNIINTFGPNYLQNVFTRIESICPNFAPPNPPPTIADLTVSTNLNLATSRARGVEFGQRLRMNPHLFFDGYYDAQSTTIFDAPVFLLKANPTLIPGSQLPKIPLHKWAVNGDFSTPYGLDLYMDYTHYDGNNDLNRPAYGIADISLTQQLKAGTSVNIGISNLFNQYVDTYGRIGFGVFIPENRYGTDPNGLAQGSERFGLSPAALSVTVTQRL
jgi:outer membrane receptor protein involved in Fe transport